MSSSHIIRWIGSPSSLVIHTAVFSLAALILALKFFPFDVVMLIWNTAVSLEAIYLSIFIQMSVNNTTDTLSEIEKDIDDISDDIEEISDEVVE